MKKVEYIHMRVTTDQKVTWLKKSKLEGVPLSKWITNKLCDKENHCRYTVENNKIIDQKEMNNEHNRDEK